MSPTTTSANTWKRSSTTVTRAMLKSNSMSKDLDYPRSIVFETHLSTVLNTSLYEIVIPLQIPALEMKPYSPLNSCEKLIINECLCQIFAGKVESLPKFVTFSENKNHIGNFQRSTFTATFQSNEHCADHRIYPCGKYSNITNPNRFTIYPFQFLNLCSR